MARRLSRGRGSEQIERDEEEKQVKRKAMAELELRRLTRQTRMMKEAKLKDAVIEKNTKVKNILYKENDDLVDNLALLRSRRRCILDTKQSQNIANLFAQGDDLDAAIADEKNYIKDLQSQIQKDSQNIEILKEKKVASVSGISDFLMKEENERADRNLESWKSKLAAEQTQLALVIKDNREMRMKLQRFLKEKGKFNQLFEELIGKLSKGKRIMADIVEQSRQEFQKRDEVARKIEALKSRDKADLAKRMEEMQDLEKKLYEDKKLADFRLRVQIVREHLGSGARASDKNIIEQEKLAQRLEKTSKFWFQLQEITGLNSCDEICKHITSEEANLFSLFNFNNEIRDQLEVLTQKAAELVRTVDDEQTIAEQRLEQELKIRNSFERRLEILEQKYNDLSDVYDSNARMFSRLLDKIKSLFDLMNCQTAVLQDLLGNNQEVTEFNYKLYLRLVETAVINALESMDVTFLPMGAVKFTNNTMSAVMSKSVTIASNLKSVTSVPDKKILTMACCECEEMRPTSNKQFIKL